MCWFLHLELPRKMAMFEMSAFQCSTSNPISGIQAYFILICSDDKCEETTWMPDLAFSLFLDCIHCVVISCDFFFFFFLHVSNIHRSGHVIAIFGNHMTIATW